MVFVNITLEDATRWDRGIPSKHFDVWDPVSLEQKESPKTHFFNRNRSGSKAVGLKASSGPERWVWRLMVKNELGIVFGAKKVVLSKHGDRNQGRGSLPWGWQELAGYIFSS